MRAALPHGIALHVGLYVSCAVQPESSPAWDCSSPSATYARLVLEGALRHPSVEGVTIFVMAHGPGIKRDVVAAAYGSFDGQCPADVPFRYVTAAGGEACCHTTSWLRPVAGSNTYGGSCDGNGVCCLQAGACGADLPPCSERCPLDRPFRYFNGSTSSSDGPGFCCAVDTGIRPSGIVTHSKCPTGGCCLSSSGCGGHSSCSNPPAPPGPAAHCPADKPHLYGSSSVGEFCCRDVPVGGSTCASGACCLVPGSSGGCQSEPNCTDPTPLKSDDDAKYYLHTDIPPTAGVSRPLRYQTLGVDANQTLKQAANGRLTMGTALAIQFVPLPPGDTIKSTGVSGNNGVYPPGAMPKLVPLSAVDYKTIAFREYSMASPENMCKMDEVEHLQGNFTWEGCDLIANFSIATTGMSGKYMGTCTVWGVWNPDWLPKLQPVQKEAALVELVTKTIQRYAGGGPSQMECKDTSSLPLLVVYG